MKLSRTLDCEVLHCMRAQKFDIEDAIRFGWETTKANLNTVIVLTIAGGLATGIPSWIAEVLERSSPFLSGVFRLASVIMSLIVGIGALRVSLRLHDGQPVAIGDLFAADWSLFRRYLVATIAYSLIVGFGLLLFVIPGLLLAVRFAFYGYIVVERDVGPYEALAQSETATQGARMDLFLLGLLLIVLNVLGAMLVFIGLLISIPVSSLAFARAYRTLTAGAASPRTERMRERSPQGLR